MNAKQLDNAIINEWIYYKNTSTNPNFKELKFMFAMYVETNKPDLFANIKKLYPNSDHQQIIDGTLSKY